MGRNGKWTTSSLENQRDDYVSVYVSVMVNVFEKMFEIRIPTFSDRRRKTETTCDNEKYISRE